MPHAQTKTVRWSTTGLVHAPASAPAASATVTAAAAGAAQQLSHPLQQHEQEQLQRAPSAVAQPQQQLQGAAATSTTGFSLPGNTAAGADPPNSRLQVLTYTRSAGVFVPLPSFPSHGPAERWL